MWSLDHIIHGLVAEQLTEKYGTKHNEILYGLAMKMMPTCHENDANFMALS